ncbi:E3 ubiquitin-protein ligase RNF26-like [Chamaea fasciata]|uniref:E3 ubiquitin-protein ligase RNF26-like n=1 Tax=Chamaea fasciata TaxID=190680 RepID=UPI00336AC655
MAGQPELRRGLRLLRDVPLLLPLLLLDLGLWLCCGLLAALLCLLRSAAAACGAQRELLRGCCEGAEGLLGRPGLSGLRCGQLLRVGGWLLTEPGKVFVAGTRSLFKLLGALWGWLAGSVLRVSEVLAAFLALVAGRAGAVPIRLWLHCQLAFKLLCSATVVFLGVYFLVYSLAIVCHSGAQSLGTALVTLWDSLTSLIFGVTDLLAAFLARVSSGAIAVSTLLWWLCQMASELLCSITKAFISICLLVSSLVKSLSSLCLMGGQYLSMLLATLWDLLSTLILGVTNTLVMVLAYLFRPLLILLWLPFQLALLLLSFVTQVFTIIFFLGVYTLGLLLRIVFLIVFFSVIYCNREVLCVLKGHLLDSSRRLQPVLWQLYQVAVVTWHRARTSQHWHRLVDWVLTNWRQAGRRMNQGRDLLDAGQVTEPRPALGLQSIHTPREEPGTSWWKAPRKRHLNATARNAEGTLGNNPWTLLKEQEEQKKCVICQDQTKTVLLLPCRHLCLCQECTEELLKRDFDERTCPLCRQVILQTLNVYL